MKIGFFELPIRLEIPLTPSERDVSELMLFLGNNSGNLLFRHAVYQFLDVERIELLTNDLLRTDLDVLLLPLANMIDNHENAIGTARYLTRVFSENPHPEVLIFGLGAQSSFDILKDRLSSDIVDFLRMASKRCRVIFLRDENTQKILHHYNIYNTRVMGCPSILLNPSPNLGETIRQQFQALRTRAEGDITVTISYQRKNTPIANELIHNIKKKQIIVQTNDDGDVFQNIKDQEFFYNLDEWVNKIQHVDISLGTRIHNTILHLMCGKPAICLSHDARTFHLCRTLSIPSIPIERFHEIVQQYPENVIRHILLNEVCFDAERFENFRWRVSEVYHEELSRCKIPIHSLFFPSGDFVSPPIRFFINVCQSTPIQKINEAHLTYILFEHILDTHAPDFEPETYRGLYQDLENCDTRTLILHYLRHGKQEGRHGHFPFLKEDIPDDFHGQMYVELNPDLEYLSTDISRLFHYLSTGRHEGRPYNLSLSSLPYNFDCRMYLELNPDLQAFKNDTQLKHHYLTHGIHEGRAFTR